MRKWSKRNQIEEKAGTSDTRKWRNEKVEKVDSRESGRVVQKCDGTRCAKLLSVSGVDVHQCHLFWNILSFET